MDLFDAEEFVECRAPDCPDGEVLAVHRAGYCPACCPWHTIVCPDCIESLGFDDDQDDDD